MNIEEKIFKRHSPDFKRFKEYGFKKSGKGFVFEKTFEGGLFKAIVKIKEDGSVFGEVIDLENNDEFLPLRIEGNQGAFVNKIRLEYEKILSDIREKCFVKEYFVFPQSNRIAELVFKKYGARPEFLWEKFEGSGVFRNSKTKKWYLAILVADRSKFDPKRKGPVEAADIKLSPEKVEELIKKEHFYPGYHMNKKYWLSIILDDSVLDDEIMKLIDESYGFSKGRKGGK